jgi:tRNA (cytidine/uridine-2'-O-)-methyltransferase
LHEHDSFNAFIKSVKHPAQLFYITKFGKFTPSKFKYRVSTHTYFIFGKESLGLPKKILAKNKSRTIRILSSDNVRSLNLANCVAIMCYEYVRQLGLKNT